MTRYLRISYTHRLDSPRFPGNPGNQIRPVLSFDAGNSCNAAEVVLFNHNGTHIDFPNHYWPEGKRLFDYQIEDFVFRQPAIIDVQVEERQPISAQALESHELEIADRDLLLIRTGFSCKRRSPSYVNNPYLTTDAADYLRRQRGLRALGIDFLSVTNAHFQNLGDQVHRILLNHQPDGKPLLLIEDLDLSEAETIKRFRAVFVIPLFVEGVDGMPCTVFGEYETGGESRA